MEGVAVVEDGVSALDAGHGEDEVFDAGVGGREVFAAAESGDAADAAGVRVGVIAVGGGSPTVDEGLGGEDAVLLLIRTDDAQGCAPSVVHRDELDELPICLHEGSPYPIRPAVPDIQRVVISDSTCHVFAFFFSFLQR